MKQERVTRKSLPRAFIVVTLVVLGLVAACSDGSRMNEDSPTEAGMLRTMTAEQARVKADQHIRDAMTALPKQARLEPMYSPPSPCDDPTDNGPKGRVEVGTTYWIRDLPDDANEQYFDTLLNYWRSHNFTVRADSRPRDYFISVENNDDSFYMSIAGGASGALSIGASSPCVWPNGTAPPSVTSGE